MFLLFTAAGKRSLPFSRLGSGLPISGIRFGPRLRRDLSLLLHRTIRPYPRNGAFPGELDV